MAAVAAAAWLRSESTRWQVDWEANQCAAAARLQAGWRGTRSRRATSAQAAAQECAERVGWRLLWDDVRCLGNVLQRNLGWDRAERVVVLGIARRAGARGGEGGSLQATPPGCSDARRRVVDGLGGAGQVRHCAAAQGGGGLLLDGTTSRPAEVDCLQTGSRGHGRWAAAVTAPLLRPSRRSGGRQRRHRRVARRRRAVSEARHVLAREQQRGVRCWVGAAEAVVDAEEGRVRRAWGRASSLLGSLDALDSFGAKRAAGLARELRAAGSDCRVGGLGLQGGCFAETAFRGYEVAFVMRGLRAGIRVEPRASGLARLEHVLKLCEEWLDCLFVRSPLLWVPVSAVR